MAKKTYSVDGIDFSYLSKGKWRFQAAHHSKNFTYIGKASGIEMAQRVASLVSASLVRSLKKENKLELDGLGRATIKNLCD